MLPSDPKKCSFKCAYFLLFWRIINIQTEYEVPCNAQMHLNLHKSRAHQKNTFFLHLLHLVNWLLASLPLLVSFFVSFSYDKAMGVTNAREKTAKAAAALHPFQLSRRLIIFSSYYKCVKNLLFCHFPHCCSVFGLVARSSRIFCWQSSCRQWSTQLQPSSISCTYICTVSTDPLSKMEWKQNKSNVWVICEGFVCANTVLKKCIYQKIR